MDSLLGEGLIAYHSEREMMYVLYPFKPAMREQLGVKSNAGEETRSKSRMEEMAEIRKRFGDEQSSLLDQFERMSFEAQLNRAMLGRSLSEPGLARSYSRLVTVAPIIPIPPLLTHQIKQGRRRRGSAFHKVLKKLLRPILGRKTREEAQDLKHPLSCKTFSRSMRF